MAMNFGQWAKAVFKADKYKCRGLFCDPWGRVAVNGDPHHIKLRSQGGKNELGNGITLCHQCHEYAHGRDNLHIHGKRVTGRQFMIMTLDRLVNVPGYRWAEVHEELRRKRP